MSFSKKQKKVKVKKDKRVKEKVSVTPGPVKEVEDKRDGFTMIFECWKCKNRLSMHYSRLEAVNSNTVGDCEKCGGKDSYETVKRISDR